MKKKRKRVYKRRFYHRGKRCSRGEKRIACFLDSYDIQYHMEHSFDDCKSPKNYPLRFDFYLYEFEILIEFQGHHHYGPVNEGRMARITHEKTVLHDGIKKSYIIENRIVFIEIAHWDFDKIETILKTILNGRLMERDELGQENVKT